MHTKTPTTPETPLHYTVRFPRDLYQRLRLLSVAWQCSTAKAILRAIEEACVRQERAVRR